MADQLNFVWNQISMDLENDVEDPERIQRRKRALASNRKSPASRRTLSCMQKFRQRVIHCDVSNPDSWPEDVTQAWWDMKWCIGRDQHGTLAEIEERMYPQAEDAQMARDFYREIVRRQLSLEGN